MNMALKDEFESIGGRLFRWRSYLPLVPIILLLLAIPRLGTVENGLTGHEFRRFISVFISFMGLGLRCYVVGYAPKGTSGGNTRRQVADLLNTKGAYSVVRHPLYLGNFLIWLGVSTFVPIWWISVIFVLLFWLYYERIMFAEEAFLREKFGSAFEAWAKNTPAFFPSFKNWKQPDTSYSIRKVLRRE